jgi:hypothetical protein
VIVDVNVHLSRWPFRRLRGDETPALVSLLREKGVAQAWAGTFDGAFHFDLGSANARLADECRRHGAGFLVPFGAVNPAQVDWEEDLRRCADVHRMPGIRLYPNYHGYALDHPDFAKLLKLASERRLIVQLATRLEDPRTQHPLARVANVDPAPLAALLQQTPTLRFVLLNGLMELRGPALQALSALDHVWFDLSSLEGQSGLAGLVKQVRPERILFGSQAPFLTWDAARLKVKETALDPAVERGVLEGNARALLR